jgi:hypothetical protein
MKFSQNDQKGYRIIGMSRQIETMETSLLKINNLQGTIFDLLFRLFETDRPIAKR